VNYTELSNPLYHGSDKNVTKIDLSMSALRKDFGRGFYTTGDRGQAEKFARLKANRSNTGKGYVSAFSFKDSNGLKIKKFDSSNEEWFDFVLANRGYGNLSNPALDLEYDIIIGPVANDAVGVVLNLFVYGTYGDPTTAEAKEMAIRLLLTQKLHNQVFFGTGRAVANLRYLETYDVCID